MYLWYYTYILQPTYIRACNVCFPFKRGNEKNCSFWRRLVRTFIHTNVVLFGGGNVMCKCLSNIVQLTQVFTNPLM